MLFRNIPCTFREFHNIRFMMVFPVFFYPYEFIQVLHVTVILASMAIYGACFMTMVAMKIIVFLLLFFIIYRTVSNIQSNVSMSIIVSYSIVLIIPLE